MTQEIERKFLAGPDAPRSEHGVRIRQGYLVTGPEGEARLRDAGGHYTLTVKSGSGLTRGEWETAITGEQFERLWPATEGSRLEKRRDTVPVGDVRFEIDRYEGTLAGLVVAEVEFETIEDAEVFTPPAWVEREVTGDKRYSNASLAARGLAEAESA